MTDFKIERIIFGLGSNLGDRKANIDKACVLLEEKLHLKNIKRSTIFENPALLKPNSPKEWDIDFFNIAASGDIDLKRLYPEEILNIIKGIEIEIGRKKSDIWAPREIDIDILAIGNLVVDLDRKLQIPHKSMLERDFFKKTFAEIEPNWKYPIEGKFFGIKICELI